MLTVEAKVKVRNIKVGRGDNRGQDGGWEAR